MDIWIYPNYRIKAWADTAKFTDVIVGRLRKCSDLIRDRRR